MNHAAAIRVRKPLNLISETNLYPLQVTWIQWGLISGCIASIFSYSWLTGLVFFVLFWVAGLLWRKDEPPILAFCLLLQWLTVFVPHVFEKITGRYPGGNIDGDMESAVFLYMVGYIVLSMGVRFGLRLLESKWRRRVQEHHTPSSYNVGRIFRLILGIYIVGFFLSIAPVIEIPYRLSSIFAQVFAFLDVFVALLWLSILEQRKGYIYGIMTTVLLLVVRSISSQHAIWAQVLFIPFVLLLREWKPWSKLTFQRQRNKYMVLLAVGIFIALFFMGLLWQGGVKQGWRSQMRSEIIKQKYSQRAEVFQQTVNQTASSFNWSLAWESLAERLSGEYTFSRVLLYVPKVISHTHGELTWRAIRHVLMPRFLFPNKPGLGSNSVLVRRFTGQWVAGEESDTSIGFSIFSEFYVDFGKVGMFLTLFLWGLLIGLTYRLIFLISPSFKIACAVVVPMFMQSYGSDGEFAYAFGGLLLTVLVYSLVLLLAGRFLHRWLLLDQNRLVDKRISEHSYALK